MKKWWMSPCMACVVAGAFASSALAPQAIGANQSPGASQAAQHPYNLDDLLRLEATGDGAASAGRIVWEQAPRYDRLGYYGHSHIGAWGETGFQLRTLELTNGAASAGLLFEPAPQTSYWIDSLSPDGRYVAFYAAHEGVYFMGAYDTRERRLQRFDPVPLVDWNQGRESVWISPEEFVYSAYAGDVQPLGAARPDMGRRLEQAWQKSWSGQLAVSIDDSALAGADAPRWKPGRLIRANARTGELTVLAEGKYESAKVSSSGRYLAALRQGDLPPRSADTANDDWVRARHQLVVFDLTAGDAGRPVAVEKDVYPETLAWAPDADRLAFFAWDLGQGVRSGFYHAFDAGNGGVTPYPHRGLDLASERERGFAQKPERVMWIDGRLAVLARAHDGGTPRLTYRDIVRPGQPGYPGKADWFLLDAQGRSENLTTGFTLVSAIPLHADAKTLTVLADDAVWRVGPGRAPENLSAAVKGTLHHPSAVEYSTLHRPFPGTVVLEVRNTDTPGFALVDLVNGRTAQVGVPQGDAEYLAGSVQAGAVLFRSAHANGIDLVLQRVDGRTETVAQLNRHLAAVTKTDWRLVSYPVAAPEGPRELKSCMLLPPDYQPGRRYPVIVEIYPSRGANCVGAVAERTAGLGRRPSPYSEHLLAAHGYIVFKPNIPRELSWSPQGPLVGMNALVEQGLDALVAQGFADPERIGLMGFSQGGFSSLWLASQSDRYKAVVSLNGWTDMYSHYFDPLYIQNFPGAEFPFTGSAGRYEARAGTDFSIGRKPYEDLDAYVRNSPLFRATDFSAPTMLIHSDMDMFALSQYERMFVALSQQGKPARMLRYWGEGHAPSSPANIRHMWGEIFGWFDRYLAE